PPRVPWLAAIPPATLRVPGCPSPVHLCAQESHARRPLANLPAPASVLTAAWFQDCATRVAHSSRRTAQEHRAMLAAAQSGVTRLLTQLHRSRLHDSQSEQLTASQERLSPSPSRH